MESFKVIAPTRVDLAGGTLDLWPLNCLFGGAQTINVAINLNATAVFEVLPAVSFSMEVQSGFSETFTFSEPLDWDEARKLSPPLRFPVAVLSEFIRQHADRLPEKFIKLRLETEAPLRSGLGGSSTLCVAIVRGISRLFHDYVNQGWQWQMLQWVRDVEAAYLRIPTGTQDYLAALFGGFRCYRSGIGMSDATAYPDEVTRGLSERLMVLFSGEMHESGLSNWEVYRRAIEADSDMLKGLHGLKEVADQMDTELNSASLSWKKVGKLFDEEWRLRKHMLKVTTPRLEEIVEFLKSHKVLGAKVCGAAQGGSLIALVEPSQRAELAAACEQRGIRVLEARIAEHGVMVVNV